MRVFVRDDIVEKLADVLSKQREVVLAYLIGSIAETGISYHDIDIAVLLEKNVGDEFGLLEEIRYKICKTLRINEDCVDVVPLDRVDASFMYRILTRGVKLIGEDRVEKEFVKKLNATLPEATLLSRLSLKEWLKKENPREIDWNLIKRRLDTAYESLEILHSEILPKSLSEVVSSNILRLAFERAVHTAVETILDVCRHIVSVRGWGPAETYRDFVKILGEKGVLNPHLAEKLDRFVSWRNILVHRYLEVNYAKLYEDSKKLGDVIREFKDSIRKLGETEV